MNNEKCHFCSRKTEYAPFVVKNVCIKCFKSRRTYPKSYFVKLATRISKIKGYNDEELHKLRVTLMVIIRTERLNSKYENIIGSSVNECRDYIANMFTDGMSWDNHGEWHIDHIKPVKLFRGKSKKEQHKCFHYGQKII